MKLVLTSVLVVGLLVTTPTALAQTPPAGASATHTVDGAPSTAGSAGGTSGFSGVASGIGAAAGGAIVCAASGVAIGAGTGAASAAAATVLAVPTIDHSNLLQNTITASNETTQTVKECILDGITVAIREALIASITDSIINWINNGFEGGPAFVTDLRGFLGDVADQIAVDFILGDELEFLCSPFQLQVRLALSLQQRPFRQDIQCSLGDVSDNIEGFLKGNFSDGGFPALFELSTNFNNNPYGAHLSAKLELEGRQSEAINEKLTKLSWSGGFFSSESCDGGTPAAGEKLDDEISCRNAGGHWTIKTPGTVINAQLQQALGSGQRQLELADEIDEIISALLAQLAQKALTSLDGLRGLSSRHSSSATVDGSYLERLTQTTQTHAVSSSRDVLILNIAAAQSIEAQYQAVLDDELSLLGEKKDIMAARYQCYLGMSGSEAALNASTASTTVSSIIRTIREYERARTVSVNASASLNALALDVEFAQTTSNINAAGVRYDTLVQSGSLQSSASLTRLIAVRDLEKANLDAIKAETGNQCLNISP